MFPHLLHPIFHIFIITPLGKDYTPLQEVDQPLLMRIFHEFSFKASFSALSKGKRGFSEVGNQETMKNQKGATGNQRESRKAIESPSSPWTNRYRVVLRPPGFAITHRGLAMRSPRNHVTTRNSPGASASA